MNGFRVVGGTDRQRVIGANRRGSRRLLLETCASCAAFAALTAAEAAGALRWLDWAAWLAATRAPIPGWVAALLSASCSLAAAGLLALALAAAELLRGRRGSAARLLAALAASMAAVYALKHLLRVERPLLLYHGYAYPSGHSARAAVLAEWARREHGRVAGAAAWLWALGVAASRLLLGAHWLSDVAGGVLLGVCVYGLVAGWKPRP